MLSLNRTVRSFAVLALSGSVAALGACGSTPATTTTSGSGGSSSSAASGSGGGATTTTAGSTTGSGGSAPVCPGPGFGGGETLVPGGSVTATIIDQNGAAVPNQPVYICGIDICSNPGKTGADGKVAITTNLMMKKPAFKFGDALTYAELGVTLSMVSTDLMTVGTAKLPAAGAAFAVGADAVSGGVTVSVPAGGSVSVNELVYDTPDKQLFRAAGFPVAQEATLLAPLTFTDGGAGFAAMFGVSPTETLFCPAAKVKAVLPSDKMSPNNFGWLPKAAVEFWVMTIDVGQEYAPYGGWAKASDGVVSDDGTSVSTVDGGGFVYLDSFGVRLKP
jgi:hypothetical protein